MWRIEQNCVTGATSLTCAWWRMVFCFYTFMQESLFLNVVWVWPGASLKVLCMGFSFGQRSCPQKCSRVRDLTAQASGQALIRSCESKSSASRSVLPSIGPSPTLLFSTLLHLCVYLQPADLSVPPLPQDLLRPSFHQRKTSPLTLSMATTAVFIR